MSVFGKILATIRETHNLTQEGLVEQLILFSSEFSALNRVTYSRWETGKTSTSFKKKRKLLTFFAYQGWLKSGPAHDLLRSRFENLFEPLTAILDHKYQSLIANVPQLRIGLDEYSFINLQIEKDAFFYECIIDIEVASNPKEYYTVTSDALQKLCHHPNSFSIVCERNQQHLGHFVMLKLNSPAAQSLVHNQIDENSLTLKHLCDNNEKGSYYIHAMYGCNPVIAALLNTRAYVYLFDNIDTIDNVVIFSSRADGRRLANAYGIKTVAKGENIKHNFTWHGMESPVEDILFSDTVIKLIF